MTLIQFLKTMPCGYSYIDAIYNDNLINPIAVEKIKEHAKLNNIDLQSLDGYHSLVKADYREQLKQ